MHSPWVKSPPGGVTMKHFPAKADSFYARVAPLDRSEPRPRRSMPAGPEASTPRFVLALERGLDRYAAYVPLSISARFWKALARARRAQTLAESDASSAESIETGSKSGHAS